MMESRARLQYLPTHFRPPSASRNSRFKIFPAAFRGSASPTSSTIVGTEPEQYAAFPMSPAKTIIPSGRPEARSGARLTKIRITSRF